jgi:glutamate dehydrogenase
MIDRFGDDRVLRGFLSLVDATLRTNYFVAGPDDAPPGSGTPLVMKLDSKRVPGLPQPRPNVEVFVHSPRVEGIHLRAGPIARGGLRWSERPDDFRTEVLDLAFAQVKKNAIIVPTGAKGGFVCRSAAGRASPQAPIGPRPVGPEQVRDCYEEFVTGLLEVTDNIVNEKVVTPRRVVAFDGPDPYLVVAADKGTASFSDLANSISERTGFWLGDAFASGGSRGYDHKAMGITARGAWVAVRRHFRELGIDVQKDPIRVVGVGDMSGDVFGNGMLQSRAIKLVAAFDHRHVFVDPDPDPALSFEERSRLAGLARSSWADYRQEAISAGGGVWAREVKSVPVSAAARAVLGMSDDPVGPPELISAILSAPVDLLWFGGIGTYVKSPDELDVTVGDRANDDVRITSDEVRARVVAEGANLGVTQKARIRYSRRGGRINADFIDNAAGVATSDREVNLKILLALAVETGALPAERRDEYLRLSEPEVAEDVLRQVDHSVAALNRAADPAGSAREIDAYEALIDGLEASGSINREVEVLPGADEIRVRREAGAGLIRPELAVVLAYAKSELVSAIEASTVAEDPGLSDAVVPYFPRPIRESFGDLIPRHRLYRQLAATDVAGELVDRLGIVWAHETAAETGCGLDEVASAFWAAREVSGAGELWSELDSRAGSLQSDAEAALHEVAAGATVSLARAYLARPSRPPIAETVAADGPLAEGIAAYRAGRESPETGRSPETGKSPEIGKLPEVARLVELGVDESLAASFVLATIRASVSEVGPVVRRTGRSVEDAVDAIDSLRGSARVDSITALVDAALTTHPLPGRFSVWQARALLDDLAVWTSEAAEAALSQAPAAGGVGAVATWLEPRAAALGRATSLAASPAGADPLAVAALSVRRLHALLGA